MQHKKYYFAVYFNCHNALKVGMKAPEVVDGGSVCDGAEGSWSETRKDKWHDWICQTFVNIGGKTDINHLFFWQA